MQHVLPFQVEGWQAEGMHHTTAAAYQQEVLLHCDGTDGVCTAGQVR
jgi:hypothetical protein